MRAYLGLIGREGNEAEPARLRLQRGSPALAVGSEHAGDVQKHEDEVGRMGDEEFR